MAEVAVHGMVDWISNDMYLETPDGKQVHLGFLEDVTGTNRSPLPCELSVGDDRVVADYKWRSQLDNDSGDKHWVFRDDTELNTKTEEAKRRIQSEVEGDQNMRGETVDPNSLDWMNSFIKEAIALMINNHEREDFEISMGTRNTTASAGEMDDAINILQTAQPIRNPHLQ
jgi:hypothetical protein